VPRRNLKSSFLLRFKVGRANERGRRNAVCQVQPVPFECFHLDTVDWEMARSLCERLFMPDKSGNYKSSFAIAIITFLVSTEAWFVKAS